MSIQRLEYIMFNKDQLIDTGVKGTAKWEFDIQFTVNGDRQLMGYHGSSTEYWGIQENGRYGLYGNLTVAESNGDRDLVTHCFGENNEYYLDVYRYSDKFHKGLISIPPTNVDNLTYKLGNLGVEYSYGCTCKLYALRCIQNGKLIRNFIPCVEIEKGNIGLYDQVNGKLYFNIKSGNFIAGPINSDITFGCDGTVYCDTIEYKYKQARNIVADNSGTDYSGIWTMSNMSYTTDIRGYKANGCFLFPKGNGIKLMSQPAPQPIANHKYYGAIEFKTNTTFYDYNFHSDDARFEWWIGDGENERLTFANKNKTTGADWVLLSSIQILNAPKQGNWVIRNFQVNPDKDSYCSKLIIIDLTDTFGAGNEPTREWCDMRIREHEVFQGYGVASPNVPMSNLEAYTSAQNSYKNNYNWCSLNSRWEPRSYMYNIRTYTSFYEGFLYSATTPALMKGKKYYAYFQCHHNYDTVLNNVTFQTYWPEAEPHMGTVSSTYNDDYNSGGGMKDWKRISFFDNRDNWASGGYKIRYDIDGNKYSSDVRITDLQMIKVEDVLEEYNKYIYENPLTIDDIDKSWCDRWIDGRSSSIIHIQDSNDRGIQLKINPKYYNYKNKYCITTYNNTILSGAYVDTGIIADQDTKIEIQFILTGIADNDSMIFGAGGNSYTDKTFEAYTWRNSIQFNYDNQSVFLGKVTAGEIITIIMNGNHVEYTMGGVTTYKHTFNSTTFMTPKTTITLGALNRTNGILKSNKNIDIIYCNIYKKGMMVRSFVPIRPNNADANHTGYLYDMIENKVYEGKGNILVFGKAKSRYIKLQNRIKCNNINIKPEKTTIEFTKQGEINCRRIQSNVSF